MSGLDTKKSYLSIYQFRYATSCLYTSKRTRPAKTANQASVGEKVRSQVTRLVVGSSPTAPLEWQLDKERIELFKDRTTKNRYRYDRAPSWYMPVIKSFIFDYTNSDISPSIDLDIIVNKSNDIIVRVL